MAIRRTRFKLKRTRYPQCNILKNIGLIKQIASSFHQSTHIEMAELVAEANLAYLESITKWDPARSKITTFMWHCLHSRLINFYEREKKHMHTIDFEDVSFTNSNPSVFDMLDDRSSEIAQIIIDYPEAFVSLPREQAKDKLKNILYNKGWKEEEINLGFTKIQKAFDGYY